MRKSYHLLYGNDLFMLWKNYLHSQETMTREEALQIIEKTVTESPAFTEGNKKSLLSIKNQSLIVWKTLDRHNVKWSDCLSLMEAQLNALSPTQKKLFEDNISNSKSFHRLPNLMIETWNLITDLSNIYLQLLSSKTIIQFASLVQVAIRENPQFDGILPVTPKVLEYCYKLGEDQPEVTLECCKNLSLTYEEEKLLKSTKESLTYSYAMLHAKRGQWNLALSILNTAREVRPSSKRLFFSYINRMNLWVKALSSLKPVEPHDVAEAITYAPNWISALKTFKRLESPEATRAILARSDFINSAGWELALNLCNKANIQSYSVLRPILATIPSNHSQIMQLHANYIKFTSDTMYAGTLTRRAYKFIQKSQWTEAIGLLSGCHYYDVALPIVPFAPRASALPHSLLSYEEAVHRIKSSNSLVNAISLEEQLAVAIHGDWTQLKNLQNNTRLKSLILAKRYKKSNKTNSSDNINNNQDENLKDFFFKNDEVQCFTFQNEELAKLVCLCANFKAQKYFMQVIPNTLRHHHFGTDKIIEPKSNSIDKYNEFFLSNDIISEGEKCNMLCSMIVQYLRNNKKLTGENFLREISKCLAYGKIKLKPSNYYELSFAILRASTFFNRLDSNLTSRIVLSTPIQHFIKNPEALEICINSLVLTGQWERAFSFIQHTKRPYSENFAVIAYIAPREIALKVLKILWKDNMGSYWILLLQDLLYGDIRFAKDELKKFNFNLKLNYDKKQIKWRKRILGACCSLLKTSQSMHSIVRAANISSICSLDIDEYGLNRLLKVLSWDQALIAINDLLNNKEVIEENWGLIVCTKSSITLDSIRKITSLFPFSPLLHAIIIHNESIAKKDLNLAVKSLIRYYTLITTEYKENDIYFKPFVGFLKNIISHFDDEEWKKTSLWPMVRRLFNQIVEGSKFPYLGREGRESIPQALRSNTPMAALIIIGFLYHKCSRALQVPVQAALTSRLLLSCALRAGDAAGAFYFFKCLKHPRDEERAWLVWAWRGVPGAGTHFINAPRFTRPRPEQVLLWSDERLEGRSNSDNNNSDNNNNNNNNNNNSGGRWRVALELLAQPPPAPETFIKQFCSEWGWAEVLRALELLRRTHGNSSEAAPYIALLKNLPTGEGNNNNNDSTQEKSKRKKKKMSKVYEGETRFRLKK